MEKNRRRSILEVVLLCLYLHGNILQPGEKVMLKIWNSHPHPFYAIFIIIIVIKINLNIIIVRKILFRYLAICRPLSPLARSTTGEKDDNDYEDDEGEMEVYDDVNDWYYDHQSVPASSIQKKQGDGGGQEN